MRKYIYLAFLVLIGTILSCEVDEPTTPYAEHGINFNIPEGWTHTESPIPDAGVYIMVERSGEDESGQFIISVLDNLVPLDTYMSIMRKELTGNLSLQGTEIKFTDSEKKEFNGADALACKFIHSIKQVNEEGETIAIDYQGELMTFHCGKKSVYIFIQEAKEDASKNRKGLATLKSSFACAN